MSITLEKVEKRVYVVGNSFSIKDQLKAEGCHWDAERKQWWIGVGKASAIEAIIKGDTQAVVQTPETTSENADSIKVVGKAKYKGKTYYVRWVGQCKNGEYKAHLTTIDAKISFWAACARPHEQIDGNGDIACVLKTYQSRTVGYGRYAHEEHTTLGSLRRFIERQKNPETRIGECTECGHHGPSGQRCTECGGEGGYI